MKFETGLPSKGPLLGPREVFGGDGDIRVS